MQFSLASLFVVTAAVGVVCGVIRSIVASIAELSPTDSASAVSTVVFVALLGALAAASSTNH